MEHDAVLLYPLIVSSADDLAVDDDDGADRYPAGRESFPGFVQCRPEEGLMIRLAGLSADRAQDDSLKIRRLPKGSVTAISRVPQGMSSMPGRANP